MTATSLRIGFTRGYTNCEIHVSKREQRKRWWDIPLHCTRAWLRPQLFLCLWRAFRTTESKYASRELSQFIFSEYAERKSPTCTPTPVIITNISIQFPDVVAIHSSGCTGEYTQNSIVSSFPGTHISSCWTFDVFEPPLLEGTDGFMFRRKRQDAQNACQAPEKIRDTSDGGWRGSWSRWAETNLAFGEKTGSGRWCRR